MLRELLSIFRPGNPLIQMAAEFARMIELTCDMTVKAGHVYFGESIPPEERTRIYKTDVKVNKLERRIRKRVVAHLSTHSNRHDLPYCLALMSLNEFIYIR